MSNSLEINNQRFNAEAANWDSNVKSVQSAGKAWEAIKQHVPAFKDGSAKNFNVLELGCGTGLLSFLVAPHVKSLVGVDTSEGMIDAFNAKIAALPSPSTANLAAVKTLLESPSDIHLQGAAAALATRRCSPIPEPTSPSEELATPYRFDLVISHLTLHHVQHLGELFKVLYDCLKPGGRIALTDYEDWGPQAIRFHPKSKRQGVEHHGLKKAKLLDVVDGVGFNECRVERAFVLKKTVAKEGEEEEGEEEMEFPFLICLGVKS